MIMYFIFFFPLLYNFPFFFFLIHLGHRDNQEEFPKIQLDVQIIEAKRVVL